jgi:hypothetical protein
VVIDPLTEEVITPSEAAALYPRGPSGKKVHVCKVYRDMSRGCHGIVLESIRTPRLATSRQAVARFFRRLTDRRHQMTPPGHEASARYRASREVEQELDRLGLWETHMRRPAHPVAESAVADRR